MKSQAFRVNDPDGFKKKALRWASGFNSCCCFDSNDYPDPYSAFDFLIAAGVKEDLTARAGAFSQLQEFLDERSRWCFGFMSYDLKNELEELSSLNSDHLAFPLLYFFEPLHLLLVKNGEVTILGPNPREVFRAIENEMVPGPADPRINVQQRISKGDYIRVVEKLKEHIRRGDIYEVNFCQEFFATDASLDAAALFTALNQVSPSPFAVFFKQDDHYLVSATPERFLSKRAGKLISQPIKGTVKRDPDPEKDKQAAERLREDKKEQAENVMIVDLVRNDLTRCAVPGTVQVEELFGIYSFGQVHQMISTVVCEADPGKSLTALIQPLFPMGSMTGAPKLRAMQLIEQYEQTKRGLYSGAAGYFSPGGDFDFNVVIRSLLYNASNKYLSFQAGSAITFDSDPVKEYEECLVKVAAIRDILEGAGNS